MSHKPRDWWLTEDCKLFLPEDITRKSLQHIHQTTHTGTRKTGDLIQCADLKILHLKYLVEQIASQCLNCKL